MKIQEIFKNTNKIIKDDNEGGGRSLPTPSIPSPDGERDNSETQNNLKSGVEYSRAVDHRYLTNSCSVPFQNLVLLKVFFFSRNLGLAGVRFGYLLIKRSLSNRPSLAS